MPVSYEIEFTEKAIEGACALLAVALSKKMNVDVKTYPTGIFFTFNSKEEAMEVHDHLESAGYDISYVAGARLKVANV